MHVYIPAPIEHFRRKTMGSLGILVAIVRLHQHASKFADGFDITYSASFMDQEKQRGFLPSFDLSENFMAAYTRFRISSSLVSSHLAGAALAVSAQATGRMETHERLWP